MPSLLVDCVQKADGSYEAEDAYIVSKRKAQTMYSSADSNLPPKRIRRKYFCDPTKNAPNWRMELVKNLVGPSTDFNYDAKMGIYRGDDSIVADTLSKYQVHLNMSKNNPSQLSLLKEEFPGPHWAMLINSKNDVERYAIEAYICTGISDAKIAEKFDVDPNDIWWYRKMYFDIDANIDNPVWMNLHVFAPMFTLEETARAGLWRVIGWKHVLGEMGLDSYIDIARKTETDVMEHVQWLTENKHIRDTAELLMSTKHSRFDRSEAFTGYMMLITDRKNRENTGPVSTAEDQIHSLLSLIPGAMSKTPRSETIIVEDHKGVDMESLFKTKIEAKKKKAQEARTVG